MRHLIHDYLVKWRFVAAHYGFVISLALAGYAIGYRLTRRMTHESFLEEVSVCTGPGLGTLAFLVFLIGLLGGRYHQSSCRSLVVA